MGGINIDASEHVKRKIPDSIKRQSVQLIRYLQTSQTINHNTIHFQKKLLNSEYNSSIEKLIIFLTPGRDVVNGGILSINSLYNETTRLKEIYNAEVLMCTIPGDPILLKYTKFENENYIYTFSMVLSHFKNIKYLMVHVPEYSIIKFLNNISNNDRSTLSRINHAHINIMLQNIELLPTIGFNQFEDFNKVTITTAHERYSTQDMRSKLGFPLHKLSVYISPERYNKIDFSKKKDLMIVSPDIHPQKSKILKIIEENFPEIKILLIKNLNYEDYKKLLLTSKWALTFGEGLDGYFIETIFSGGVSFSVYNSKFFTIDFKLLKTVYEDYDTLEKNICSDLAYLNDELTYTKYQNEQYNLCCKYYNYNKYINNLKLFYKNKYTYK